MLHHLLCSVWHTRWWLWNQWCAHEVLLSILSEVKINVGNMLTKVPNTVDRPIYECESFIVQGQLMPWCIDILNLFLAIVKLFGGWKTLKSQHSVLYERMSMLFRKINAKTLVKLLSAAGILIVECCLTVGIEVAKFQRQGKAGVHLNQMY